MILTLQAGSRTQFQQMPVTCTSFQVPCTDREISMDSSRVHMSAGLLLPSHCRDTTNGVSRQIDRDALQSHRNIVVPRHRPPPRSKVRSGGVDNKGMSRSPVTVTLPQAMFLQGQATTQGSMMLCSQEALSLGLQLSNPASRHHQHLAPCICQKVKRSSSSSSGEDDKAVSPSPLSGHLTFVAEDAFSMDHELDNSPLVPPPRGQRLNCYENIPVPEIIPLAKSPRPSVSDQSVSQSGIQGPDWISDYSRMSGLSFEEGKKLRVVLERLEISGFYYESISAQEAKDKLRVAQVGTFLIRRSSQSSHFFALSVKTNRGTTSIRIAFDNGGFRLDADPDSASKMPSFDCVLSMVQYYVSQSASDARNKCVFLESNGRRDTPVILTRPLREQVQPLRHLCRRRLHYYFCSDQLSQLMAQSALPCSIQTRDYIQSYPYPL